ncbi:MAG: NYN domain-containing protein [Candidatus Binatia bacterium]|jgi:hypothetical protein|nr:NYN domain-containing protein [Candidatus Binatia bacterium]
MENGKLAVLIDFTNIAIGVEKAKLEDFRIGLILNRLNEKGSVLVKRAYGDWVKFRKYRSDFEGCGVDLIEMPTRMGGEKNRADIRMVVDALELVFSRDYLNTFAIISGDSDFSPLASKLREYNRRVIGLGVKQSTSELLVNNCDEFIFYDDLVREQRKSSSVDLSENSFDLLIDSIYALQRENAEVILSSNIKGTMLRKNPSFSENQFGFKTFSKYLEAAQGKNLIRLARDEKSGTYKVADVLV